MSTTAVITTICYLTMVFSIPSLGTVSPLKECNGSLQARQAIVDTEELALYQRYSRGHLIGDHVGSIIDGETWDMSLVQVGDIGILYTEQGVEYYECISVCKVRNTGRDYRHRGKPITVDKHDIIALSCTWDEEGYEVCAYFDYCFTESTA